MVTATVLLLLSLTPALAHNLGYTRAAVVFHEDQRFELDLYYEVGNILYGPDHEGLDPVELYHQLAEQAAQDAGLRRQLRQRLEETIQLRFDGMPAAFSISFPRLDAGEPPRRGALPGSHALLTGAVPADATTFVMQLDPVYGDIMAALRAGREGPIARRVVSWGDSSEPYFLSGEAESASLMSLSRRYAYLGFTHIMPLGLDHILFVLGLFLLNTQLRPLLLQVTAFTVAHSLTLALAMYGWLSLPAGVVEPLIALSIAYVALENIATSRLTPWRPAIVFGFGLLHGLGFAGVLHDLGLPRSDFVAALIAFNIGVELGQLAVLALAFAVVGWLHKRIWYRHRVTIPASVCIAATGIYWSLQRIFLP